MATQMQNMFSVLEVEEVGKKVVLPPKSHTAMAHLAKTRLCKHFMQKGECIYGNKCLFAHGKDELRKRGQQWQWQEQRQYRGEQQRQQKGQYNRGTQLGKFVELRPRQEQGFVFRQEDFPAVMPRDGVQYRVDPRVEEIREDLEEKRQKRATAEANQREKQRELEKLREKQRLEEERLANIEEEERRHKEEEALIETCNKIWREIEGTRRGKWWKVNPCKFHSQHRPCKKAREECPGYHDEAEDRFWKSIKSHSIESAREREERLEREFQAGSESENKRYREGLEREEQREEQNRIRIMALEAEKRRAQGRLAVVSQIYEQIEKERYVYGGESPVGWEEEDDWDAELSPMDGFSSDDGIGGDTWEDRYDEGDDFRGDF